MKVYVVYEYGSWGCQDIVDIFKYEDDAAAIEASSDNYGIIEWEVKEGVDE